MQFIIEHWEELFTLVGIVLTPVAPTIAAFWWRGSKAARELLQLIDQSPEPNFDVKLRANREGKKLALKALARLAD
ncbi:MAG: hypothetical protein IIA41_14685 [SAR324 cluster bacterium]|nr:hypothetical protein [SAR324 cluster bacterium]